MGNFPESSSQEILVGIILVGRLGVGPVTHRSASPAHEPTACRFATSGRCITIILIIIIIIIILLSLLSLLSLLIVVIITIIMIIMIMCIYIYIYVYPPPRCFATSGRCITHQASSRLIITPAECPAVACHVPPGATANF